jgi:hypothetical protein
VQEGRHQLLACFRIAFFRSRGYGQIWKDSGQNHLSELHGTLPLKWSPSGYAGTQCSTGQCGEHFRKRSISVYFLVMSDADDDAIAPEALREALRHTPRGAFALAGLTTGLLIGAWLLFYFLVFLPRGQVG